MIAYHQAAVASAMIRWANEMMRRLCNNPFSRGGMIRSVPGSFFYETAATKKRRISQVALIALVALFLSFPLTIGAVDFRGSSWVRNEDSVPQRYIVLFENEARILIPKFEGYSIDGEPNKLRLAQCKSVIGISTLDGAYVSAVRRSDRHFLELASKPNPEVNGESRLVAEEQDLFAARKWSSFSFEYTCSAYGIPGRIWVAFVVTPNRSFRIEVSSESDSFAKAKVDAIQMLMRMREVDKRTFEEQFFQEGL